MVSLRISDFVDLRTVNSLVSQIFWTSKTTAIDKERPSDKGIRKWLRFADVVGCDMDPIKIQATLSSWLSLWTVRTHADGTSNPFSHRDPEAKESFCLVGLAKLLPSGWEGFRFGRF
jgi:hypothetical protein